MCRIWWHGACPCNQFEETCRHIMSARSTDGRWRCSTSSHYSSATSVSDTSLPSALLNVRSGRNAWHSWDLKTQQRHWKPRYACITSSNPPKPGVKSDLQHFEYMVCWCVQHGRHEHENTRSLLSRWAKLKSRNQYSFSGLSCDAVESFISLWKTFLSIYIRLADNLGLNGERERPTNTCAVPPHQWCFFHNQMKDVRDNMIL